MARKRSERRSVILTKETTHDVAVLTKSTEKVLRCAFCPVCGKTIAERRGTVRTKIGTLETMPYFDSIIWEKDKPFGMIVATTGKSSFKNWQYIDKEDAPELFNALKARFIDAIREWQEKGWIKPDEINNGTT